MQVQYPAPCMRRRSLPALCLSTSSERKFSQPLSMTTSEETEGLDLPELRVIVDAVRAMPFADRATLMKALIPSITQELQPNEFEAFVCELRLKGERWYEADTHPGQGRATRTVPGERTLEGR